jgi:4-hydroxyphenylpyruvate dioxygenase-like putative hemolysin
MYSAILKAGSAVVVLIQGTTPDSQVSKFISHFGPGVQHIAFEVTDLDRALETVRDTGGKVDAQTQDSGIRQVFLRRDPGSGVRVELIERRGGHFTDVSVRQLFLAFEQQDLW